MDQYDRLQRQQRAQRGKPKKLLATKSERNRRAGYSVTFREAAGHDSSTSTSSASADASIKIFMPQIVQQS